MIDSVPFLKDKPTNFLAAICPHLRSIKVAKGETIFMEGDRADESKLFECFSEKQYHLYLVFFLKSGQVAYVIPQHHNFKFLKTFLKKLTQHIPRKSMPLPIKLRIHYKSAQLYIRTWTKATNLENVANLSSIIIPSLIGIPSLSSSCRTSLVSCSIENTLTLTGTKLYSYKRKNNISNIYKVKNN